MNDRSIHAQLRALPAVDHLLGQAGGLVATHGRALVTDALRRALEMRRQRLAAGQAVDTDAAAILSDVSDALQGARPRPLRRVINATGVVVHTNLGRAPLSPGAVAAMLEATGYCDLEFDLATGERGARGARLDAVVAQVTGTDAALVVNNAAAALVLVVAALAPAQGVVVSRGELIEIGGSFRLPDIIASAGARLVEVGTTNKTRAADYAGGEDVGMLLKMHPSNYRIVGFTAAPSVGELATVARQREVPLVYDVGSGLVSARDEPWASDEPTLRGAFSEGADLVIASGDKLLGGPQAGLIAGRADLVDRCRRHPLARALRLDKLRVAALLATMDAHLRGQADHEVPVWRMLTTAEAELDRRCRALSDQVPTAIVDRGWSVPGGGSAPGAVVHGPVVSIAVDNAESCAYRLRQHDTPIVVRIERNRLIVDLRTVAPEDDPALAEALSTC